MLQFGQLSWWSFTLVWWNSQLLQIMKGLHIEHVVAWLSALSPVDIVVLVTLKVLPCWRKYITKGRPYSVMTSPFPICAQIPACGVRQIKDCSCKPTEINTKCSKGSIVNLPMINLLPAARWSSF